MSIIIEGTKDQSKAADRQAIQAFPTRQQIQNALDKLTNDLTTLNTDINALAGAPTNAAILQVLRHMAANQQDIMQNQKNLIQAVSVLIRQASV